MFTTSCCDTTWIMMHFNSNPQIITYNILEQTCSTEPPTHGTPWVGFSFWLEKTALEVVMDRLCLFGFLSSLSSIPPKGQQNEAPFGFLIRKYDPQTQCWCTHFFPWAKMTYVYRVIHVWDVHILNTPPSCIVHSLWTCYDSKAFAPDALPVAKICPNVFMCFSHVSLFTGFVHKSAAFCFVPTAMIFSSFFATR